MCDPNTSMSVTGPYMGLGDGPNTILCGLHAESTVLRPVVTSLYDLLSKQNLAAAILWRAPVMIGLTVSKCTEGKKEKRKCRC